MKRALGLVWTLILAVSCGSASPPPASPPALLQVGHGLPPDLRLWEDATIFSCVHQLMGGAQTRVWVEMYEFGRRDLAAELVQAKLRGADVRLIFDPTVPESRRTAQALAGSGVPVRAYPVDDARHQIDHVKLLMADSTGLVGGMNWGVHSDRNHDYAIQVAAAEVIRRLADVFEQDWSLAGGQPRPLGPALGIARQTTPGDEIRGALLGAAGAARHRISAEVFVLTDASVLMGLVAARRRGAAVRVLLDPRQEVNRAGYSELRASGVDVRWFPMPPGAKLHAKAGLFDGKLLLGSANWSFSGLSVNHELDLLVDDPKVTRAFSTRFEKDWAAAG